MKNKQYEIIPTANGFIIREPLHQNTAIIYEKWHVFESFDSMVAFLFVTYNESK